MLLSSDSTAYLFQQEQLLFSPPHSLSPLVPSFQLVSPSLVATLFWASTLVPLAALHHYC